MTRVYVLGVGPGDPETAAGADLLAQADLVLATPSVEATVLFYVEAWRVERVEPAHAVRAISGRSGTVVLAVAGDPAADPACTAVLDGLEVAGIEAVAVPGVSVVPPRLSPLW